jgi:putative oxidoreductase
MEAHGLFVLRVVVGLLFVGHGAQKLFGWFGGDGLFGTADFLRSLGLRRALLWAVVGGLTELVGGLLLALGLLMPLGPLAIIAVMLVATVTVHWTNGLWAENGGFELPLTNMAIALALALSGPGAFALDTALGIALPMPGTVIGCAVLVVLGVGLVLASRSGSDAVPALVEPSHAS